MALERRFNDVSSIGICSTAGILYAVNHQPLAPSNLIFHSFTFGQVISYYTLLRGASTFIDGLIYLYSGRKEREQPTGQDVLTLAGGIAAVWYLFTPPSLPFSADQLLAGPLKIICDLMLFLFLYPLIKKISSAWNTKELSALENYTRGAMQLFFGGILLEGSCELILKSNAANITDNFIGISGILFKLALCSWYEFFKEVRDLNILLNKHDQITPEVEKKLDISFLNVIKKGIEAGGWTILATMGFSNPLGWGFLGGAALISLYHQRDVLSYCNPSKLFSRYSRPSRGERGDRFADLADMRSGRRSQVVRQINSKNFLKY